MAQDLPLTSASASRAGTGESAPLDLNRATEAQLLELPGVGPSRAKAILAFREANGGFRSVSQLLRIKGFGRAMLKRLRPLLVVASS
jgi:competence protein ComEA